MDLLELIDEVNEQMRGEIDFAFLPGDNADDGSEEQYKLVRNALGRLQVPVQVITGDHDRTGGSLDLFKQYLETELYRAVDCRGFRLLFLNALDGKTAGVFDFGSEQIRWLEAELLEAQFAGLRPLVFTHLYPSELKTQGSAFSQLIRDFDVELVEMGHTHYNELANDGRTIYAATRSTGQIEEGPPGFSITSIDGDVVSWKFKERGPWPFIMITSPADEQLITRPSSANHVVRGTIPIRAKAWGGLVEQVVTYSIDDGPARAMQFDHGTWESQWHSPEVPDGVHRLSVCVEVLGINEAMDEIAILVSQSGEYAVPARSAIDFENAIGAWPAKGILGTQLGPNENGTKGPWPAWRGR